MKAEAVVVLSMALYSACIAGTIWAVKRSEPKHKIYWLIGSLLVSVFVVGLLRAPVAIAFSLLILAMFRRNADDPLAGLIPFARNEGEDRFNLIKGAGAMFAYLVYQLVRGIGYAISMLFLLGWFNWLKMAWDFHSFAMLLVGLFPPAMFVTAPVGAYAIIFEIPQWVTNTFAK